MPTPFEGGVYDVVAIQNQALQVGADNNDIVGVDNNEMKGEIYRIY